MDNIIIRTIGIIIIILSIRAISSRFAIRSIERLSYTLLEKKDGYETREYPDHILAQTTVPSDAKDPNSEGFRIIA